MSQSELSRQPQQPVQNKAVTQKFFNGVSYNDNAPELFQTPSVEKKKLNKGLIFGLAGDDHTVMLREKGEVSCVGYNSDGQCNTALWSDVTEIAADGDYTVGLKEDGTVIAAGENDEGLVQRRLLETQITVPIGDHRDSHTVIPSE